VTETGEEPRQKGRVDVPGFAGTVDNGRRIELQPQTGKELGIRSPAQELGRYSAFGRSERFRIQVDRTGKVTLEIGEQVAADVHHIDRTVLLPASQLIGGHQSR
jgi:hypothetical protein